MRLNSLDSLHSPHRQKTRFGCQCSIMPELESTCTDNQSLCDIMKQQLSCAMGSVHEQVCRDGQLLMVIIQIPHVTNPLSCLCTAY